MSTTAIRQLPLPTFFKAKNADDWAYEPNHADLWEPLFGERDGCIAGAVVHENRLKRRIRLRT